MAFNVDQFRTQLASDGARPNLFEVQLDFPSYVGGGDNLVRKGAFMCKTAQLPGSTVGVVEVPYFGRPVKVAGNRTFAEWSVTVINDEDFLIRNALERWHRGINDNRFNTRNVAAVSTSPLAPGASYAVNARVFQYGKAGKVLKSYNFIGMFPSDIAAIDLDWGSNDTIEEYTVTFTYQYWESADSAGVNPSVGVTVGGVNFGL